MSLKNPFHRKASEAVHALTRAEEEACFKQLKQNALANCDSKIKDFVECSKTHQLTVVWKCRKLHKEMNKCLNSYTTQEELDKLKLEKIARKRQQAEKENS
ncbi:uncharacterized protein VTP21DRAFT_5744 [Calcarisporiella thermophila]|uniref:uncharacterized protein n=1 Tax=Calcarisporiella thermophila TaxID=911321 RepID=UPI003743FC43